MAYKASRVRVINLDRMYNARTRRIITTACTNVIHLAASEREISHSAAQINTNIAHVPKI